MRYALGHALNATDLFVKFPVKKLKMKPDLCKKLFPDGNKRDLSRSIFITCMELVINDIIDNNVEFRLPVLGRTESFLYMKRISGKRFKSAYKKGRWRNVDFLETNFCGYQIYLAMKSKTRLSKEKRVYLAPIDRDRIDNHANAGKQY